MLKSPVESPTLEVGELLSEDAGLKLSVHEDKGMACRISSPRIQKPGLAFARAYDHIQKGRVQVLGKSEMSFASTVSPEIRLEVMRGIAGREPACFLLTSKLSPFPELLEAATEKGIALMESSLDSSVLIDRLTHFLED